MARITIVMDDDIQSKIRKLQAEMLSKSETSVSFSKVTNLILGEGLKHFKTGGSKKC